ncbi:ATP-dependent DNA helicase RecG [Nocardioides sp. AE5]|uniref:ATP-dependent DNA helicase RecG n=1 Tax=Nocardioides sp. AE5 TaxID=2962573 RepID=UPI0028829406|nr:ATP-dependent DNA helicase RecG [Nocardioides sp. AE5]MDT0202905.1 ATP-dependent DNA helicase RecG [Nocardioides sp. AE5]
MTGINLDSSILSVLGSSRADDKKAKALQENLGVRTVGDLLWHFPRTYLETGELTEMGSLEEGQPVIVVADVLSSEVARYRDRRNGRTAYRVDAVIRASGPPLRLTLFAKNQKVAEWHVARLEPGTKGVFTGKLGTFNGKWQLAHPQMVKLSDDPTDTAAESARAMAEQVKGLFPIYRTTGKVETWDIQRVVAFALTVVDEVPDPLDEALRERYGIVDIHTALRWMHAPDDHRQLGAAHKRFRFEEALVTQVVMARRRVAHRSRGTVAREGGGGLQAAFEARLPFTLTDGQVEIGEVLSAELASTVPMNRLLQGEVGSGKTLVALRAMLQVVDSGGQAVLLAPTEVLAQQHHRSITAMLGDLAAGGMLGGAEEATVVELLTGSMGKAARREALLRMASGEAGIVIGTHALLEENVTFNDLGLVVVDEQHRFGVEQRAALAAKSQAPPHVLVMTATPIPRTVAMTVFGDLEVSTLRELPAGRAPIQTNVVALREHPAWLSRVWERVREEVDKGHQVYVVCPRITGDDPEDGQVDQRDLDANGDPVADPKGASLAAVEELAPMLAEGPLSGLRVEQLHGRLPAEEKDGTMRAFAAGEIDVLVSTTVIEVGVDVANATTMVLLDADRFGVSQLHQLRGRVGRGGLPGLCLLVTNSPAGTPARERLDAVAASNDGFALAEVDLRQRHEGDVLGAGQSGWRSSLQHLRVLRDATLISTAREAAEHLLANDPMLARHPELAARVDELDDAGHSDFMERS